MPKQIIITGAAGGLGTKVTQKFLDAGYQAYAITQAGRPEQKAQLQEATGAPASLSIHPLDLLDGEAVQGFFGQFDDESLRAAAFLAGGFAMGKMADTSEGDLDKMIALNFKTAFHSVKHIMPKMAKGGRIMLVSARPAIDPNAAAALFAYSISKGMVKQLADIVNVEGQERNVQAVSILPSIIDTAPNRQAMPKAEFDDWVKPSEIADAMLYACSESAGKQRAPVFKMYGGV